MTLFWERVFRMKCPCPCGSLERIGERIDGQIPVIPDALDLLAEDRASNEGMPVRGATTLRRQTAVDPYAEARASDEGMPERMPVIVNVTVPQNYRDILEAAEGGFRIWLARDEQPLSRPFHRDGVVLRDVFQTPAEVAAEVAAR